MVSIRAVRLKLSDDFQHPSASERILSLMHERCTSCCAFLSMHHFMIDQDEDNGHIPNYIFLDSILIV